MDASTRIKKAVGYLDGLEFSLADRLAKVRNSKTLLLGAIKEIEKLKAENSAFRELMLK